MTVALCLVHVQDDMIVPKAVYKLWSVCQGVSHPGGLLEFLLSKAG